MMNPYSGFKRGRSWNEAESSSFESPKHGRFDDSRPASHPVGQQPDSQGYQGFHGEPSDDYGHQELDRSQGASSSDIEEVRVMEKGVGSTLSRLMNLASDSGGDSGLVSSGNASAGSSSHVDDSGYNQHQHKNNGARGSGRGGGMHSEGFRGRGDSFGNPHDASAFITSRGAHSGGRFPGHSGAPRGRGIGYDTAPQFGQDSGGFDVGGGGYNQGQFSTNQRAGGRGGGRGGFGQKHHDGQGRFSQPGGGYRGEVQNAARGGFGQHDRGQGRGGQNSAHEGFSQYGGGQRGGGQNAPQQGFLQHSGGHRGGGQNAAQGGFGEYGRGQRGGGQNAAQGSFGQHSEGYQWGGQNAAQGSFGQHSRGHRGGGQNPAQGSFGQHTRGHRGGGQNPAQGGFGQYSGGHRGGGQNPAQGGFGQQGGEQRGGGGHGRSSKLGCDGGSGQIGDGAARGGAQRGGGQCGSVNRSATQDESHGEQDGDCCDPVLPGHGKTLTRPDGVYYRRKEHELLQFSSKLKENTLPLVDCFANLCNKAKKLVTNMPRLYMAYTTLEQLLLSDDVCLTPAYSFKGERRTDSVVPMNFRCKIYINNILMASGVESSKVSAKNKACRAAIKILGSKDAQTIIDTHEKVNVMALGKQDSDIVESPLSSVESNVGILLAARVESNEKKSITDFYIKHPEEVDVANGMNSTSILRQSADFSKLLLSFEFTTSPQGGFLCSVNLEGETLATATAAEQNTAKNLASHAALQNLRRTNWTILVIKRDKPKPAAEPITATIGRISLINPNSREQFAKNIRAYLEKYFAELDDYTKWLSLSQELTDDERVVVDTVGKEMNLLVKVELANRVRTRAKIGPNDPVFQVVQKRLMCQDLFDYIWEKGGETWRYKLKAPADIAQGELAPDMQ